MCTLFIYYNIKYPNGPRSKFRQTFHSDYKLLFVSIEIPKQAIHALATHTIMRPILFVILLSSLFLYLVSAAILSTPEKSEQPAISKRSPPVTLTGRHEPEEIDSTEKQLSSERELRKPARRGDDDSNSNSQRDLKRRELDAKAYSRPIELVKREEVSVEGIMACIEGACMDVAGEDLEVCIGRCLIDFNIRQPSGVIRCLRENCESIEDLWHSCYPECLKNRPTTDSIVVGSYRSAPVCGLGTT